MKKSITYKMMKTAGLALFAMAMVLTSGSAQAQTTENNSTATATRATAVFASGCFWGTEYMFQKVDGVISTQVGYTGGFVQNPTYRQVLTGRTGHAEAMKIVYDPRTVTYEELARRFFETHDPTQVNRQGPDIGTQYRSAIFYQNAKQKAIAQKLIATLKAKGIDVATTLEPAKTFWPAEEYHQDYYAKTGKKPYCHSYKKLF